MESSAPLVSIVCLAYNHEPYIRQCLDGFVMQKTNFRFEALVHDDASTDGTADIIREYAAKYPDIIKPIYQTENQYQKKVGILKTFLFPRATGKYIAMCEGDDYWTDPLKLQKQVDFLENNYEYSICGHCFCSYDEQQAVYEKFETRINGDYCLSDLIHKHVFCSTLSILFRRDSLDLPHYSKCRYSLDIVLAYMILKNGKGFCMSDEMAVYRLHKGGVWSSSSKDTQLYKNLDIRLAIYELEQTLEAATFIHTYINTLGRKWITNNIFICMKAYIYMCQKFGLNYVLKSLRKKFINL